MGRRQGRARRSRTGADKEATETAYEETSKAGTGFIEKNTRRASPSSCWWNVMRRISLCMLGREAGQVGPGRKLDGMVEDDAMVGALLKKLDELCIANNTVVRYPTENGLNYNTWPTRTTTFRSEKTPTGRRVPVPAFVRWPGQIPCRHDSERIVAHEDWLVTFAAIAGDTYVKERLLKGTTINGRKNQPTSTATTSSTT